MYAVDCLAVDPFPQFLEFFFLEIVIEPVCFLAALIFRHGELSITVHAVNQGKNLLGIRGQVWRQRCAGILFFGIIVGRSDGIIVVRVVIFKQIAIYLFGHGRSYLHISFRSAERFVREVGLISLARTGGQSAADFVLQSGHKNLVAFVGNNRQPFTSCTMAGLSIRSPFWLTQRRRPRPTSWRREIVLSLCFSIHMPKTLGLSQPSRRAE